MPPFFLDKKIIKKAAQVIHSSAFPRFVKMGIIKLIFPRANFFNPYMKKSLTIPVAVILLFRLIRVFKRFRPLFILVLIILARFLFDSDFYSSADAQCWVVPSSSSSSGGSCGGGSSSGGCSSAGCSGACA